ncbi:excinuclease ABC (subunit A) [Tepidanaerobacter acetatoxydans Re1]|uniref:UvrABC system protein A n=1 Tax=Tepidanaerobacter acetatoxydans (strain DSM 21804 / JCM 16047 / Re1) TaxID=1209989 RepID=F4LWR5_TEPAE|nr:excinuclease ABC subunit UvrA [Tepidanaerobacter acetatoxydans]AEE91787.1 UvrABC system protein A [Tepidanaerobacter acetatoxydans Re1]CDI40812.1 excinuclease ABC (subunit A) [Tepidanaerobacter acetatoxydans Re1]
MDKIIVKGAREHNLKNIDITIPRDKLVVITGLSGSGKSTLAFDTIYAEGQRRYVESLSAYARQFLGQMDKPDVDYIEGLSPAISIDQKTTSKNPRSTVGTVTEIYDYLRLLYARIGKPHCPKCGKEISQQTVDQMVDAIMESPEGTRIQILAPVVRGRKGEFQKLLEKIKKNGFVRIRVDGQMRETSEEIKLEKNKKHNIEIIIDRLIIKPGIESRLADSIEIALAQSEGLVIADVIGGQEILFSQNFACAECNISLEELTPRMFSFNSPYGACPVCSGLGINMEIDPELIIPDKEKSIADGAVEPWSSTPDGYYYQMLQAVLKHYGVSAETPVRELPESVVDTILFGSDDTIEFYYKSRFSKNTRRYRGQFEGVVNNLKRRYRETGSGYSREEIEEYMSTKPCPACNGARLKPESLAVTIGDKSIAEVTSLSIREAIAFFESLSLTKREAMIAHQILKEIRNRLQFLVDVGLDYLTLDRASGTLSGGESQRIRLATQIGSRLVGVLYILDEPSIGLHQRDNEKLLKTLKDLRDLGNTVLVVEHDEDTMRAADYIIDIGPGAGEHGGRVVACGPLEDIQKSEESITGQYLSGKKQIPVPVIRRKPKKSWLELKGCREHNLKNINVKFPLGLFTCVTGVSGSGKSTLVNEILYKSLKEKLYKSRSLPGDFDEMLGIEQIEKVINIDQSPIGRTPRSNPATYTNVFNDIREVFSMTPESRMRGYKPGRFSFNVRGGRCEACKGDGIIKIEMHFLADIYVPCEVCKGKRYNRETLEVKYKGKNIADVLDMTVDEALEFFDSIPKIKRKLETLRDVGLGYIKLGQPSTTLSGGEAQRVKLSTELSKKSNGNTIYILDEPTTGLHSDDIQKLLNVLQRLVDGGSTVIVIEHNLDVIKTADYIIDLGPEGGDRGGEVVATGTPEQVSKNPHSYTGKFLKKVLQPKSSHYEKKMIAME